MNLLLDTGADRTTLHPADGERLHCQFDQLKDPDITYGVGGGQECYPVDATITLYGADAAYQLDIEVDIVKPSLDREVDAILQQLPSLAGNDLLDYFDMRYARRQNIIQLTLLN